MLVTVLAIFGGISIFTYLLPVIYTLFLSDQNLKKKYNAEWALVTGGSSGIGKGIVKKLASQGINVVVVAIDDKTFKDAIVELRAEFPQVKFRECGVDLSHGDYLGKIAQVSDDIPVKLVFNNAGYITTGFFFENSLIKNMSNYEVNATACVKITHHFLNKLMDRKDKGLIAFTSSSAAFIPNPLAALYASTKVFLTTFASSIAAEVKAFGIDIVVVHPSPIASQFYSNADGMQVLLQSASLAQPPKVIADAIFSAAGKITIYDHGLVTQAMRLFLAKMLDNIFFTEVMVRIAHLTGDWKSFNQRRRQRN